MGLTINTYLDYKIRIVFDIDTKIFNKNLLLTKAYCQLQLGNENKSYASILRSFNPKFNGADLFSFKWTGFSFGKTNEISCFVANWNIDILWNDRFYEKLFEEQLVYKREKVQVDDFASDCPGKILIAEIDQTPVDGASEVQSEGFIDGLDLPPIDTWFYQSKNKNSRLLFAWIPEQFVSLVENGVAVNVIECFYWADEYFDRNVLNK
jgi:hypothetical protein